MGKTDGPATTLKLMIDQALDVDLYYKTLDSGMLGTTNYLNNLIMQTETGSSSNTFKNTLGPIYQETY